MTRLEIATALLAHANWNEAGIIRDAFVVADAIIATEIETRPACTHPRLSISRRHFYDAEGVYRHSNICKCGAEIHGDLKGMP